MSVIKKVVRYQLDINEHEYRWLKALMQNPIFDDETEEECEFRKELFYKLSYAGEEVLYREGQLYMAKIDIGDDVPF